MEFREELLTIAEIAIGIAGFSGVIAAFLQRGGLHALDRVRFIGLFTIAFTRLILAFVPIVVLQLPVEANALWAWSSGVMAVVWFFSSAVWLRGIPEFLQQPSTDVVVQRMLLVVPSVLNLLTQVLNAGGWLWEPCFLAYLFGLFVYLYAAGLMFVIVILYRPNSEHTV